MSEPLPFVPYIHPKPIRNPNPKAKPRLTTIFGIKCAEGLTMCADSQASEGEVKETTTKITRIGKNALLGCSGNELYIPLLEEKFKEKFSPEVKDYRKTLDECVRAYSREAAKDMKAAGAKRDDDGLAPRLYTTDALLAFSDTNFETHLFKVLAPYRYRECLKRPFRLSVGSGRLYSDFILKTLEDQVFGWSRIGWEDLSMTETIQCSSFLLTLVGNYERNTSGRGNYWILSKVSREPHEMTDSDIWGEGKPPLLRTFLKTIIAHHPEETKYWVKSHVDSDLLDQLMKMLSGGSN